MKKIQDFNRFRNLFPENAVRYCFDLWKKYHFEFIVTKSRITKLGDCRLNLPGKSDLKYTITVNEDLNQYSFLITYLHEIAHLVTGLEFDETACRTYGRRRVAPHGKEWKKNLKKLIEPLLLNDISSGPSRNGTGSESGLSIAGNIFPDDLLYPLIKFSQNPKASSYTDFELIKALHKYDEKPASQQSVSNSPEVTRQDAPSNIQSTQDTGQAEFLCELEEGVHFKLSRRIFIRGNLIRTRYKCKEINTGKIYLIPKAARVKKLTVNN
ncbi:MAG: SprT family zinc-dependent metalloprotease [Cytophagales bacterium]|nr:SprT family zinc-dependent metalloprotease [Cytophagales bacterium]